MPRAGAHRLRRAQRAAQSTFGFLDAPHPAAQTTEVVVDRPPPTCDRAHTDSRSGMFAQQLVDLTAHLDRADPGRRGREEAHHGQPLEIPSHRAEPRADVVVEELSGQLGRVAQGRCGCEPRHERRHVGQLVVVGPHHLDHRRAATEIDTGDDRGREEDGVGVRVGAAADRMGLCGEALHVGVAALDER
ncbi:MAG: hypothetical protein AB7R77_26105, partial [Ilumatobacteraceae bacterium]